MTAAQDYDALHHLVDRLPPRQARRLRVLVAADPELARFTEPADEAALAQSRRRLVTTGCISGGPADLAERAEDYLREHFSRPA